MTTQEMIELAVLDAVGLLEDDERKAFDAAFRTAAPELQAHIRREQTRLANLQHVLPDVQPPTHLRAAVLEAVREAIARELLETSAKGATSAALTLTPSRRVSPIWRATAIGSMAAAIVLAIATLRMHSDYDALSDSIKKNALLDEIAGRFGSRFVEDTLFDTQTQRVVFAPSSQDYKGQAAVFMNPDWEVAKLFCLNLGSRPGETFRLAVVDAEGHIVRELAKFESNGGLDSQDVQMRNIPGDVMSLASSGTLALIPGDDSRGTVVLSTRSAAPTM